MNENIFKRIETEKKLPEGAKQELVDNIESAKMAQELGELFGAEFLNVLGGLFKTYRS